MTACYSRKYSKEGANPPPTERDNRRSATEASRYKENGRRRATGAAIEQSLDHLVRAHQQRLRNREVERLGGFEVDHQFHLGRLLNRDIGRLRTF
jgi:hypothetical protein